MAQVGLVEHVERRALLARELDHVDAADEQVRPTHFRRERQHGSELGGRTAVGALGEVRCWKGHAVPFGFVRAASTALRGNRISLPSRLARTFAST